MKDFVFNKTFTSGTDSRLNACVGYNGWPDVRTYFEGFDQSAKLLCESAINCGTNVDTIIYPIVFSARHSIELFLKWAIRCMGIIRDEYAVEEGILVRTHDLKTLWKQYEELSKKCDRRLKKFVEENRQLIGDFSEIDPTGQTFRYPHSNDNQKHLIKTPIINIEVFYNNYLLLSNNIKEEQYLIDWLLREYQVGTYTATLSRKDLEEISLLLPDRKNWNSHEFEGVSTDIKNKFGLSNRKYSEALNLIQDHREFSARIGINTSLKYIDSSRAKKFIDLWEEHRDGVGSIEDMFSIEYIKFDSECFNKVLNQFDHGEIAELYTLVEHGRLDYFSEEYDFLLKQNLLEETRDMVNELLGNMCVKKYLISSCKKLGQVEILKVIAVKNKHSNK